MRYGGHVAVNDVSLTAPVGRITGLIGPNGAGKTTLFNVASGLVRPAGGTPRLHGADMSALDPAARARQGLGRTFQKMELFDSLTTIENVSLGREAGQACRRPWRHVAETRRDRHSRSAATEQAMALAGIADLADRPVAALSTGQRRLAELARCLAGEFDVLLLDEPSSGLDRAETHAVRRGPDPGRRGAGSRDPAGGARHGPGHEHLRLRSRARLRHEDLRGNHGGR